MTDSNCNLLYKKFLELAIIYAENCLEKPESGDTAQSISLACGVSLILKKEQLEILNTLITSLVVRANKKYKKEAGLSRSTVNQIVKKYIYKALKNPSDRKGIFKEMIVEFDKLRLEKFRFMIPATILIELGEPVKIVDIELITNPHVTRPNHYKFYKRDSFLKPVPYNNEIPVGAFIVVEAFDHEDALNQVKKILQVAQGFLKLFYPGYSTYFFDSNPFKKEDYYYSASNNLGIMNEVLSSRDSVLVYITQERYHKVLIKYSFCLDEQQNIAGEKRLLLIRKFKDALYWYNFAMEERDFTKKFLALITILETLLKTKNEKTEIAATIADRIAFHFYNKAEQRMEVHKLMKQIYSLRSDIIHNGSILDIKDETLIGETEYFANQLLLSVLDKLSMDKDYSFEHLIDSINRKKFGY